MALFHLIVPSIPLETVDDFRFVLSPPYPRRSWPSGGMRALLRFLNTEHWKLNTSTESRSPVSESTCNHCPRSSLQSPHESDPDPHTLHTPESPFHPAAEPRDSEPANSGGITPSCSPPASSKFRRRRTLLPIYSLTSQFDLKKRLRLKMPNRQTDFSLRSEASLLMKFRSKADRFEINSNSPGHRKRPCGVRRHESCVCGS